MNKILIIFHRAKIICYGIKLMKGLVKGNACCDFFSLLLVTNNGRGDKPSSHHVSLSDEWQILWQTRYSFVHFKQCKLVIIIRLLHKLLDFSFIKGVVGHWTFSELNKIIDVR